MLTDVELLSNLYLQKDPEVLTKPCKNNMLMLYYLLILPEKHKHASESPLCETIFVGKGSALSYLYLDQ
jgi:hypothetical protein